MIADGYPAYTTSAGWLGYSDEKIQRVKWFFFAFCLFQKIKIKNSFMEDMENPSLVDSYNFCNFFLQHK